MTQLTRFLLKLFLKAFVVLGRVMYCLEISGVENMPAHGPLVIVLNNDSKLMFLLGIVLYLLRPDSYVLGIGRRTWTYSLFSGWVGIPILKGRGRSGPSLRQALKVLAEGHPVGLVGEGEKRWDGRLQAMLPGAAWLALRSRAPLVVCVLHGGYAVWPRWARFPKLTGKLQIRIGKPFGVPEVSDRKAIDELIHDVNLIIAEEMRKLEAEP